MVAGADFQEEWEGSQLGWAGWELGKQSYRGDDRKEEITLDSVCHSSSWCQG